MSARYVDMSDNPHAGHCASTWLDDVDFDCKIKWRITNQEILARLQKISYKLLFKGLSQLRAMGTNTIMHSWIERGVWGHRQDILMNFFNKLRSDQKEFFSWLIFNETILDVSPQGNIDLIEHAHIIQGPSATTPPPVTNIFVNDKGMISGLGEFGIGNELPDIDSIYE